MSLLLPGLWWRRSGNWFLNNECVGAIGAENRLARRTSKMDESVNIPYSIGDEVLSKAGISVPRVTALHPKTSVHLFFDYMVGRQVEDFGGHVSHRGLLG